MKNPILGACVLTTCLAACGPVEDAAPLETRAQALVGVPSQGYPSYDERVVLYLTNRARTEPDKFNPQEPFDPSPPLRYDRRLSEAARFHAQHIIDASCWCADHSSCCSLEGSGEDVACAGAAGGCGAEDAGTRVARWSADYTGENMARGQRSAAEAIDGWINSSGHWSNMNAGHGLLGVGRHDAAWVQDFGRAAGLPPVAEDGIHFPNGQGHTFGITYHQPGSGGPQSALLILDGECHDLQLSSGTAELGAFEITRSPANACSRYYFFVRDGQGNDHVYPEVGSFGVGNGADCPFYQENRPADTCSPAGQTCETGDTRPCYTGPFGTRDVGICSSGSERCIGGAWNGDCRLQVTPEASEVCGDMLDNDCNGTVDEACGPPDDAGADMGEMTPMEPNQTQPPSGCAHTPNPGSPGSGLLLGLLALLGWTRRPRTLLEEISS